MELSTKQRQKMIQENSDAGLGERAIDQELRLQQSRRLTMHTLEILQDEQGTTSALAPPPAIRRMPGNGSFC